MESEAVKYLRNADLIFWDFDGVIKESHSVKTSVFRQLFSDFGDELSDRIVEHHNQNSGVSRFEKIPIYLSWVGSEVTQSDVDFYCSKFENEVIDAVIDSPWVPGVAEFLKEMHDEKIFVLITATPQNEIEYILTVLGLSDFFYGVYGAPNSKSDAIKVTLEELGRAAQDSLVIGDSQADLNAAKSNGVPFLLRRTDSNGFLSDCYPGPSFENLNYE